MDDIIRATTVLGLTHDGGTVIGADGQVTVGQTVMKHNARERSGELYNDTVLAGSPELRPTPSRCSPSSKTIWRSTTATSNGPRSNWPRNGAPTSISASSRRCWPCSNGETALVISGTGEIIEPDDGIVAIGSGGSYALAAARMLVKHSSLSAREIVEESLARAADICIYTNTNIDHRRTVTRRSRTPTEPRDLTEQSGRDRELTPRRDRPGTGQVHHRTGQCEEVRRHRPPQPLAPAAGAARSPRGDHAEQHHHDRPDRRRARPKSPGGSPGSPTPRSSRSKRRSSPKWATSGRDVESIIRDLTEYAVTMVKAERRAEVNDKAKELSEERILDLLIPPSRKRHRRDWRTNQRRRRTRRQQSDPRKIPADGSATASWTTDRSSSMFPRRRHRSCR